MKISESAFLAAFYINGAVYFLKKRLTLSWAYFRIMFHNSNVIDGLEMNGLISGVVPCAVVFLNESVCYWLKSAFYTFFDVFLRGFVSQFYSTKRHFEW